MNRDDRLDAGARATIRQIADARQRAINHIANARTENLNPDTVAFGVDSPLNVVHASVGQYYDYVRPYRVGAPELWNDREIARFRVPHEYQEEAKGDTRASTTHRLLDDIPETVVINGLLELDNWRNRTLTFAEGRHRRPQHAPDTDRNERRVYLPLNTLQATVDALSDALVQADLAAEIPEQEVRGDPV